MTSIIKLCKDCKWSRGEEIPENSSLCNSLFLLSNSYLYCVNPEVNRYNNYYLAAQNGRFIGSFCPGERKDSWLLPCGAKGKLWEKKDESNVDV